MRWLFAALVVCSLPLACGGETPPPKDSDQAAAAKGDAPAAAKKDDAPAASDSASAAATSAPAAPSAPAADSTPAPTKSPDDDVWMAAHQMPPKDVLKTMKPAQAKVHACFKRVPGAQGEVKIRFVVTNDGKVRAWKDDGSTMSEDEVTKCVGDLVKGLTFPKQKSPGDAWGTFSAGEKY
jgi:hypothetical protein